MKVKVLSSGSKGNCTYLEVNDKKYLIDLGVSVTYLKNKLQTIGIDLNQLNGIFLTHTHSDHTYGLQVFCKKYDIPVYLSSLMYNDLKNIVKNYQIITEDFNLGSLLIKVIKTSHDVDSFGYVFECDNASLVYITDTGYLNERYYPKLTNKSIYIMESNHDNEMLNNSSYPFYLKQRIRGPKGHMSNNDAAISLSKLIGENTKKVILAHLSEENNTEEKAYETLQEVLKKRNVDFNDILIAKQNEDLEIIEV